MAVISSGPESVGASGYTVDQLAAYLDAGREPRVPAVEDDAEARSVLDALARLTASTSALVARDAAAAPPDDRWVAALIDAIALDSRAGADIPFPQLDPRTTTTITEGAVRGLVRAVGDTVPGLIVARTRIDGDPADAGGGPGDVRLDVSVSVLWRTPVPAAVEQLRSALAEALATHTPLRVAAIDVTVADVHLGSADAGDGAVHLHAVAAEDADVPADPDADR